MTHAIGVDVGTTNAKVVLVDPDGHVLASASRPIPTRRDGEVASQDADALWAAVDSAIAEVTATQRGAAAQVSDIGVCSQYSSIVPVDAAGRPTAEMMLYLDQRGTGRSWEILERHPEAFDVWVERHGVPPVGSGLSLGHLLHFQHDRPDVHAATATYLEPMDFVNLRLTGRATATQCTMFTGQLCDNRSIGMTDYDDELLRLSGVDPERLPTLIPPDGLAGELQPEFARAWGVPAGVRVHAAMNDSQAGAFATGVYEGGHGGLMIGTTAVLLDRVDRKDTDLDHEIVSMPSPVPGTYLAWAENGIAGRAVEVVLEQMIYAADVLGDHAADDRFAALDAAIASVPAGSGGVLFLPWLAGSMAPAASSRMRGGFLNLSLDTCRTHLVRAMIEGTAFNLGWLLPAVETFTGRRMNEIVLGGGAARSRQWAQVLADVLDREVRALVEPELAVARAVALVASGRRDADALVRIGSVHEPEPRTRDRYQAMQAQFIATFDALRPICEALDPAAEQG
jgi:xylulokinase